MGHHFFFGPKGAEHYETVNPANPAVAIGRYAIASPKDVDILIEQATMAQAQWASTPGLERGQRLDAFLDAVVARTDDIATAVTLEQGKILSEAKAEVSKGVAEGRFMVGEAARVGDQSISNARPGFANHILRRPRGIIFCISPWNFPAMTPLRKLCPAIAFGNAVIMKPSQFTPAAACLLAEIAEEFFPKGLFQMAMVGGAMASQIIERAPIHGVSFTGSVETGRRVYKAAAHNLIPVQLELGGKNAALLNDADDLEAVVTQISGAAFQTSGQRCTAISRVLVNKAIASKVKNLLVRKASALRMGDGMDNRSQMGPLCNAPHFDAVVSTVEKAIREGAKPLTGGEASEGAGAKGGYFYKPTILGGVVQDSTASLVEIFGPVLSVLEYESFDQAISMLNGTEFGLTSALFSDSHKLVQRFLRESRHGMLHVNHGTIPDNNMPFGGIKNSGVGAYSVGPTAVNFYTSEHAAYLA